MFTMVPASVGQGGSSSLWTPANLTALPAMWQKETGIVDGDSAGNVTQWTDESGNGRHLLQASSGFRPIIVASGLAGKSVVQFDGINDFMATGTGAYDIIQNKTFAWVLHVYKRMAIPATATDRGIFTVRIGSAGWIASYAGSVRGKTTPTWLIRRVAADSASFIDGSTSLTADWHIMLSTINYTSRAGVLYIDGAVAASNATQSSASGNTANTLASAVILGGYDSSSGNTDMQVAETLCGNASISSTEVDKLFGYAAWKWGLQSLLPPGHPYKSAPPTV